MKILTDFVTNSSSSSFVAWGVDLSEVVLRDDVVIEFFNKKFKKFSDMKESNPERFEYWKKTEYEEMSSITEDLDKIKYIKDNYSMDSIIDGLSEFSKGIFSYCSSEYVSAVGITPQDLVKIFPKRLLGEAKKVVAEELNKAFGTSFEENDISYFEESWFDG